MSSNAAASPQPDRDGGAAVHFMAHNYDYGKDWIMGMNVANGTFIEAFGRHADVDRYIGMCARERDFEAFSRIIRRTSPQPEPRCVRALPNDHGRFAEVGVLYVPGTAINRYAWRRRRGDQRRYSVCGLTHTISARGAADDFTAMSIAPLQPWDALICASRAVRAAIDDLCDEWGEYLRDRFSARRSAPGLQLPVIPLGVDTSAFPDRSAAAALRASWRERLGIPADDCVFLFAGRLSYHGKASPIPMYQALQAAAQAAGRPVHLVHYGWFASDVIEGAFRDATVALCPSVRCHFVDGGGTSGGPYSGIWYAADVFTSLSDNIQESFGLTPVEAMASGLPVVVSDWDGYRDTVRDGIDGFTIPTLAPPPGHGHDLTSLTEVAPSQYDFYGAYIGNVSLATSVDTVACTRAYLALINDGQLRARMGAAAQQRARDEYDWRHIIRRYQELWRELAVLRRSASVAEYAPRQGDRPANARRPDPFSFFQSFPSRSLAPGDRVCRAVADLDAGYERVASLRMNGSGAVAVGADVHRRQVLALVGQLAPCTVADVLAQVPADRQALAVRTLVWLAKLGLISAGAHNLGFDPASGQGLVTPLRRLTEVGDHA